ncbi:MAG: helicase-related protein [Thermoplasmata archaeon]
MKIEELSKGIIIEGPKWSESIEIKDIVNLSGFVRIVGVTIHSNEPIDQIISIDELNSINIKKIGEDFTSDPWKVFLSLETKRYRFASKYDPLLAVNVSNVDPLPHQIDAVYGYVLRLSRIRFLIADDPGAGKTIMAGLIIKELKLRNLVDRILIVVPGHLIDQWRRELKDRFEESFKVINREIVKGAYGENVWNTNNQIITSMDFAKKDDVSISLSSVKFDLVIVDEAHKMSAYEYGNKTKKTSRYKLGETLSKIAEPHLLFLTATPHRGDPDNFRLFIDLLEPGFFSNNNVLQQSIRDKDNPLFIRRVKEDLKDFDGKPLFLPRHVSTVKFRLSDDEKELYNDVSRYVKEEYNKATMDDKNRNVTFALVILQRRMASSVYALKKSLERRKQKLEDMLKKVEDSNGYLKDITHETHDPDEVEELSEDERWRVEEKWETLSVASDIPEMQEEIKIVEKLLENSKKILETEEEVKVKQLKDTISKLNKEYPGTKILIFTESKDTLLYLEDKIKKWGYSVNVIHGDMDLDAKIQAEKIFKNESQIMVATEAAGEGINLQFCNLMINFDLPWNPNRLEQRMGRIHRYGQTKEVYVYNLIATDTREGKVLEKVLEKLEEIRKAMQSDKVFDVISDVFYGKDLAELMLDAAASTRSMDDILKDVDIKVDDEYITKIKKNLGDSLATKYIDYTRLKDLRQKAMENKLIPEYTEAFFKRAFEHLNGKLKDRKDGFISIESIPSDILSIEKSEDFRKKYGTILRNYPKVTFDKDQLAKTSDAEFVTFGHPLFEAVMKLIEIKFMNEPLKGSIFIDPEGALDGYILFFEGEIKDGTMETAGKTLLSYYIDRMSLSIRKVLPTIIWDLAEGSVKNKLVVVDVNKLKDIAFKEAIEDLNKYKNEVLIERNRQAEIKKKYGLKSLDDLRVKLDGEIISLQQRKENGENTDLAIYNKEELKRRYDIRYEELNNLIVRESELTMSTPIFLGIIRVMPPEKYGEGMKRDDNVEKIGMEYVMDYERIHECTPEDVSDKNLGFDIRSIDKNGKVKYIEVKARAYKGDIAISTNEWLNAKKFGDDYYLYVVWNASDREKIELKIINNPSQNLKVMEKVESVRYIASADEIVKKGV